MYLMVIEYLRWPIPAPNMCTQNEKHKALVVVAGNTGLLNEVRLPAKCGSRESM